MRIRIVLAAMAALMAMGVPTAYSEPESAGTVGAYDTTASYCGPTVGTVHLKGIPGGSFISAVEGEGFTVRTSRSDVLDYSRDCALRWGAGR